MNKFYLRSDGCVVDDTNIVCYCPMLCATPAKEVEQNQWHLTDKACLQHSRSTSEDGMQWEFVQVNQVDPEKDLYAVSHAHIDFRDFSENEVNDMLHTYGYEDFSSYVKEYPDNSKTYIMEMLFETEVAGQLNIPGKSFNEAVAEVEAITGTDLTQYKLPHRKPNLSEQISGAEQRRENHTEQTQPQREGR